MAREYASITVVAGHNFKHGDILTVGGRHLLKVMVVESQSCVRVRDIRWYDRIPLLFHRFIHTPWGQLRRAVENLWCDKIRPQD